MKKKKGSFLKKEKGKKRRVSLVYIYLGKNKKANTTSDGIPKSFVINSQSCPNYTLLRVKLYICYVTPQSNSKGASLISTSHSCTLNHFARHFEKPSAYRFYLKRKSKIRCVWVLRLTQVDSNLVLCSRTTYLPPDHKYVLCLFLHTT